MNGYVMETRQVTKTYGSFLALDHVNIHVRKGCIYGLVGDNGAGKSTLLKLLAGQSFPTKGEIEILGKHGLKDLENVRKQMGCMIEQPGFFPNMTVEQTLKYYCIQKGIPDTGRIVEMMKMTGIYEKRKSKCGTLSLGQKQRLGLGIAMLGEPQILILDEPINGLDPIGIAEVRDFIRALCEERGKTILISSHILSEIALLADDIGIIDHGVLLEEESLAELEQKNGKVLRFTVSNAPVAAQLLQQEMGVRDVAVENEQDLTVRDLRLDTGAAVRRFVEAGLVVSDAHLYEDTLEDYFKRITGGEGIA